MSQLIGGVGLQMILVAAQACPFRPFAIHVDGRAVNVWSPVEVRYELATGKVLICRGVDAEVAIETDRVTRINYLGEAR